MRMFRSMRNPVTKTGRTSNTTGSRIRTSARTIREQTGNLVQNARKKISMSSPVLGYKHATSPRSVPGSAAAAGEKARKKSYGQGQTTRQGRSAAYSAIKTAKAPSDAPLGYKAGYAVGARVAGSTYKQNILTKTGASRPYSHIQGGSYRVSTGRTGLESRLQNAAYAAGERAQRFAGRAKINARAAGIQTRRFAGNLLRNKPVQPAHIQRPVSNAPLVDRNRARMAIGSALSSAKAVVTAPFDFRKGFKLATAGRNTPGSIMNIYQSHYKTEAAYFKEKRKRELNTYGKTRYPSRREDGYDSVRYRAELGVYDRELYPNGPKAFKAGYKEGAYRVKHNLRYESSSGKSRDEFKQERMKLSKQSRLQPSMLSRFTIGVKHGYLMPDASVRQAYNAQRFSTSASFPGQAPVALASRGTAGSFAAGYGVGKLAKRAVQAPGKAYGAGQKVTFGIQDALKGVGRGFKYAAQGNIQTARYATMNAANAVYRGDSRADRLASHIVNPIERVMSAAGKPLVAAANYVEGKVRSRAYGKLIGGVRQQRADAAAAARQQRIQTATPWGPKGSVTPTGQNAVAQQVRYGMAMQQKQKSAATKNQTPWGPRNTRTPAGLNTTAQLVRFQNYMAAKNAANMGPPKPPYQPQAATPPVTPAAPTGGTGKRGKVRMPKAGQYQSNVAPSQPHPLRNKGAASPKPAASATPPPNPAPPKKTPKEVLAETQKAIRYTASNISKQRDHWENTKGFEGFAQEQESRLKALIGVARKAQKDLRPDNAAELAAAGASRTADVVARARKNFGPQQPSKVFAKPPTTGDQASLLPEEPQPRKRGQRGKDRKPRQPRGQAGK